MSKITIGISVEGQTEAYFAKFVLSRYLARYGMQLADPVILGGNVTIDRVNNILSLIADNYDYTTTLYDYYGFSGLENGETWDDIEQSIKDSMILLGKNNIIPYLQKYEFEALLFSDIEILCKHIYYNKDERNMHIELLKQDIGDLQPEEINGGITTAPSKRIQKIYRKYKKSIYGYIIAQDIGIEKIREKCPRFNSWIKILLSLGQTS